MARRWAIGDATVLARFNGCTGPAATSPCSDLLTRVQSCRKPAEVVLLSFDNNSDDFGRR
jgi:hypothetical protein